MNFSCGVERTLLACSDGVYMVGRRFKGLLSKDSSTLVKIKDSGEYLYETTGTIVVADY